MEPKEIAKVNLLNVKTRIVHKLNSNSQALCSYDIHPELHGYMRTDRPVICRKCLNLEKINKVKMEKEEALLNEGRSAKYVFLKEFRPVYLLTDDTIPGSDRIKFHTWCVNQRIPLDKPMMVDQRFIEKLDSIGCFLNWMTRRGFIKVEEVPVPISLVFKTSQEYYDLVNKLQRMPGHMDMFGRTFMPDYPPYFHRHLPTPHPLEKDEILQQLLSYEHLFKKR